MSAVPKDDEVHLTLIALWDYRMNRRVLSRQETLHVAQCDDCLTLLGLCQISESLQEVDRRLRRRLP